MTQPLIVVVGLLQSQQQNVMKKCPGLNIRFVSKNLSTPNFGKASWVVVFSKFINHSMLTAVNAAVPRERVKISYGGITKLVEMLNSIGGNNADCTSRSSRQVTDGRTRPT